MAPKKLRRYRMNWEGKSIQAAMILLGLSFFLRVAYYFGCVRIEKVGFWELLTWLILPMLVEGAMIVLLRILKWDAPGIYAILAAGIGMVLILQSIGYASILRVILSLLVYAGASVLVIGVAGGYLSKQIGVAGYFGTAALRFLIFEMVPFVFRFRILDFVKEVTGLVLLLAMGCLVNGFKELETKR